MLYDNITDSATSFTDPIPLFLLREIASLFSSMKKNEQMKKMLASLNKLHYSDK